MPALPPPRDPLFAIEHLSLVYVGSDSQPPACILNDVSVEVERGSAPVLVGPSGSGKSTLLRCLNRLAEPTGGRVRFDSSGTPRSTKAVIGTDLYCANRDDRPASARGKGI